MIDFLAGQHGLGAIEGPLIELAASLGVNVDPEPSTTLEEAPVALAESPKPGVVVAAVMPRSTAPTEPAKVISEGRRRFWVYDDIFDQGLTAQELAVYMNLCRRANRQGVCWPKQAMIARECHVKKQTVNACLEGLKKRGMVSWRKGTFSGTNRYQLHAPDAWKDVRLLVPQTDQ